MRKLIKLKKDPILVYSSNISEFLDPDFIFLPLKNNYKVLVSNKDEVFKNQIVIGNELNKIISPVSGVVRGKTEKNIDGNIVETLVIENNFKEKIKRITNQKEIKYEKDVIISKLYDFYFRYIASVLESKKINHLVINAIDDEPYIATYSYILNNYIKEILDMSDILSTVFNIKNTCIAIKNTDSRNVEKYLNKIGTYPNISLALLEDKYLLGNPFFLLEHLDINENDSLVIDVKSLVQMYDAIKYNKYSLDTFITIAGSSVAKSKVIKVKVGTCLKDIIDQHIKIIGNNNLFILNGLMRGCECDIENTVVSQNTIGLIVISKEEIKEEKCDNCGLCYRICPVRVNPKKLMDSHKISNNCIDCGLCSYICPCNINLRKFLRGEYE